MENITKEMEILEAKAKVLKALSHPIRLCIVRGLMEEEGCNVSKMQSCLEIPQSTLSQHLAKLRNLGILEGERNGVEINYYVIDEDAKKIVKTLF
ncbi:ArsR family transcriptional regulator [Orenia metallireducens]|uniref:Transcriptional regulator, ArsR family n=1 Tax=Orenia metallireducens TaxID=1413210 RepID=A0A285FWG0_9FIRM|nr:metalloregulator ArsR/SmtB family transcription factor [Orenia metallireducens]PRX35653.1 ArsR family transcriptional regulator [Orenia metallireducens]SNY15478.1 transcriptional regulator, ArsR family [Orenia metallireducens]